MNKIKLSKGFIISYTLLSVLTIVGFFLLIWFDVLKRKQPSMTDAYNTGFGYYSDPVEGRCITKTGGCGEKGTQIITKKCITHPVTGKGCILPDGSMSYDDLIETQNCKKQCIGSAFTVSDGLEFKEVVDENNVPYTIILGSGGNKVINNFGIDVTNQFIKSFDAKENKYILKRCFNPNQYQVYSTTTYDCQTIDSDKASNNCVFTCGVDDVTAIRLPLINDNDIGLKIPNYPKVDGRYVCFDQFGNNQIEIFNSGNVPNDFLYPNFCYDHYITYGTSNSFTLSDDVNIDQTYFTLLNQTLPEYNLYFDYNFYHPLIIGNQYTMAEKIINLNHQAFFDPSITGTIYIDTDSDNSSKSTIKIISGSNVLTLNSPTGFSVMEDNNIIRVDIDNFLDASTMTTSDYFYKNETMHLNYSTTIPSVNDYIFFKINSQDVDNKSSFGKITSVDTGTSSFGVSISDLFEDAYKFKIRYWNTNTYFNGHIDGSHTVKNRVENNKYFLSELILPTENFQTNIDDQLVNVYNNDYTIGNQNDIFYLFSETSNSFFYPASRFNYTNSTKFNIDDYPKIDFYLLKGGLKDTIYPPNKFLNLPSYEELVGFIQGEVVSGSYTNNVYTSYIKQLKLLSSGVSSSGFQSDFRVFSPNGSSYLIDNLSFNTVKNTVVKRLSKINRDIGDIDNPYVKKIKLYNDILTEKDYNFVNKFGTNFNFNIKDLKATVLKADYTVFRTPSICFNEFNLPVQPGTIKQLNPNQTIKFNKLDTLNSDDHRCGFFGVSIKTPLTRGIRQTEDRVNFLPALGLSSLSVKDYNNYFNDLDFLTPGYELTNLFCYRNIGSDVDIEPDVLCRKPYTTRNYQLNNYYNPEEDLLEQFKTVNLFYSNQDNNIDSPSSARFWNMIVDYNQREFINSGIGVYSKLNNYSFIYNSKQEGYTGENLAKLGVYYLYNKNDSVYQGASPSVFSPTYYLFKNYYQNNWSPDKGVSTNIFKTQPLAIYGNKSDNFIYNVGLSIGTQIGVSIGLSLYNTDYVVTTKDKFQVGDHVNPDFNLFNSALIQEGISVFSFPPNSGYQQLKNNDTLITGASINNNAQNGDLIFIAFDNKYNILDNDFYFGTDTNIYNYAFEVCKITDFDKTNKKVTLERNLMNYPKTSLFNGVSVPFMAYKFSDQFNLNLLFPITKVTDNDITFQVPIFYNNTSSVLNTSISQNAQSRTAFSMRIIKNEVEVPNDSFINSDMKLYLLSSPENFQLSAYLDLIKKVKIADDNYAYYFNELKSDQYSSNNLDTNFKTGDIITFSFPNVIQYDVQIIGTKAVYENTLYDYYGVTNQNISQVNGTTYNIDYFDFTPNKLPNFVSLLTETINPDHKDKIEITTNSIGSSILPANYSSLYYQGVSEDFSASYYNNYFINLFNNQFELDIASNNLIKMTLKTTRLYNNLDNLSSYLTITNIVANEKPYGPTYLNNLATSNNLDFSGYGTIVDFDIDNDFLEIKNKGPPTILTSLSGLRFGFQTNVAKFSFVNAIRNEAENFKFNQTYSQNEIVSYNYSDSVIYNNSNNVVSLFDANKGGQYNQPYYIFQDSVYKFPLYLEKISGGTSLAVDGISGVKLWHNNLNLGTSIPNTNIYKNFTSQGLSINSTWEQTSNSLYPVIDILKYNNDEYYQTGQIVEYENDVYESLIDNFNNIPSNNEISWQYFKGYNELYDNKGNFINVNTGVSTVASNLTLTTKIDTVNYPISIVDYSTNKYYGLFTNIKGIVNYQDKLSSYLNLSLFNLQKDILAKIIIFKTPTNNNILSLAASPCTEDDLKSGYGFFKQFSPYQTGDILSQYIYNINLPDKNTIGKPFCSDKNKNPKMNSNISSYQFSNSISFLPTPVALEYQDYPFTIYNGTSICNLPPNSIFNYTGTSTINAIVESSNGDINYKTITFKKSFYKNLQSGDYNSLTQSGTLKLSSSNVASYTTGTSNYYIINLDSSSSYSYLNNQYLNLETIAKAKVVLNQYQSSSIVEENINILNVDSTLDKIGTSLSSTTVQLFKVPTKYIFTGSSLTDDNYVIQPHENTAELNCYLTFDNGNFIAFDKIYISNSDLSSGDKIYFLSPGLENQLKIKLYGFFQKEYLSPIVYQSKNLIKSSTDNLFNLIFSPFTNQVLNPYKNNIQLIESGGTSVVVNDYQYNEFSDVFNLGVSNNQLSFTPNIPKYPIYNTTTGEVNDNIVYLSNPDVTQFGIIDTNSVTELISKPFDINDYVILGGISDIIPTGDENNDTTNFYRETKGALNTNLSWSLTCSIYKEDSDNQYTIGETIDCYQGNQGLFNIVPKGVSQVIYEKTINNSFYNTETFFFQSDNTNQNLPLYISTQGGNNFKSNILLGSSIGVSRDIIINYYYNSTGVSKYYDLKYFNRAQNKYLTVTVTKNNFFQDLDNYVLYLGTSSPVTGPYQFTNGISTLTYQDN